MGFYATAKKIINIVDWFTSRYEGVVEYVKKKVRAYRARKIRRAIDSNNTSYISKRVRILLKKRRERNDSN